MLQTQNPKQYDLEDRTLEFARRTREFIRKLPKNTTNFEDCSQLTRSSGSVGANYIEANESLSKRDFTMRVKISRKETKESIFWLKLVDTNRSNALEKEREILIDEGTQLMKILGSIVRKTE